MHQKAIEFLKQMVPGVEVNDTTTSGANGQLIYKIVARPPGGQWANYAVVMTPVPRGHAIEVFSSIGTGVLPR